MYVYLNNYVSLFICFFPPQIVKSFTNKKQKKLYIWKD